MKFMRRVLLLTLATTLEFWAPKLPPVPTAVHGAGAQVMIAVPPRLTYNSGPCALVTGGGVGPQRGELCYQTDINQLFWWNLTQWQPIISGLNPTLTAPTVVGGLAVNGGTTITGGASVAGGFTLIGATPSSLVFTNAVGNLTTSSPGILAAQTFQSLSTAPNAVQLVGDITIPISTGPPFGPGFGAVTIRVRRAFPGTCILTVISGASVAETQFGAPFPCS